MISLHDIHLPAAAFGADQPLAPLKYGRAGAVPSSHLGGVGLDLMLHALWTISRTWAAAALPSAIGGQGSALFGRALPITRRPETQWRQVVPRFRTGLDGSRCRILGVHNVVPTRGGPSHSMHPTNIEQAPLIQRKDIICQCPTLSCAKQIEPEQSVLPNGNTRIEDVLTALPEALRHAPIFSKRGCSPIKPFAWSHRDHAKMLDCNPQGVELVDRVLPSELISVHLVLYCDRPRNVRWANRVINGDPDRDRTKPVLRVSPEAPAGDVALLSFRDERAEAEGVAALAHGLIRNLQVARGQILVLLRGDFHGQFSKPVREQLTARGVPCFDPTEIDELLDDPRNRRMLEVLRLLENPEDAIAWASLLKLTPGIGDGFADYVYARAREGRISFGHALLEAFDNDFPAANLATARREGANRGGSRMAT
jgi:hypothetical protein